MIDIYNARDLLEAEELQRRLIAAGVPAKVTNRQAGGIVGEVPVFHASPKVTIAAKDVATAALIVAEFETQTVENARRNQLPESDEPIDFCYYCGATTAVGASQCEECCAVFESDSDAEN